MRTVAEVSEIRAADRVAVAAVGESVLIGRAAAAIATAAIELLGGRCYGRLVTVLAGSGHNGADALRAGAILARRGAAVVVVRSSDQRGDDQVDAALTDAINSGARTQVKPPSNADLVIDGMVGVGSRTGPLTGRAGELVAEIGGQPVLAVDIPSGVNTDTGRTVGPAINAAATVTFGSLKPGLLLGAGRTCSGQVIVADIGLNVASTATWVVDAEDVATHLPHPKSTDDKRTRGVVGVIAGSEDYPGAGMLCVGGAVRSGAGYVRAPGAPREVVAAFPSAVAANGRSDAWVVGPGMDDQRWKDAHDVILGDDPLVIDASGLDHMGRAGITERKSPTIITPHAGEFQRLLGIDPSEDPVDAVRFAAAELGAIVLLKGATTLVGAPDGSVRVVLTPTPWLATAGTGDVLSGVVGSFVAKAVRGGIVSLSELADAVAAAAFLHGVAGRVAADRGVGEAAIAADELLGALGEAAALIRSEP